MGKYHQTQLAVTTVEENNYRPRRAITSSSLSGLECGNWWHLHSPNCLIGRDIIWREYLNTRVAAAVDKLYDYRSYSWANIISQIAVIKISSYLGR